MSSMRWAGDRLIQCAASSGREEELGFVKYDSNSKTYVIWLRNYPINPKEVVRGDEYSSMEEAKREAFDSASVRIMHFVWLRRPTVLEAAGLLKDGKIKPLKSVFLFILTATALGLFNQLGESILTAIMSVFG